MKISKITLRNLFSKGQKPNQEAFFNFFDSFWHKDEEIDQSSVKGLESTLSNKLDKGVETTLLNAFNDAVKTSVSGVKGEAFPSSSPTHYDPATYPNGLYEKWDVTTAGTYVNFIKADTNPVEVTTADLDLNQIQIAVTNGVAKKLTKSLPQAQNKIDVWVAGNYSSGKQVINPNDQSIYEANSNVISSDIPGVSTKWVKIVGGESEPTKTTFTASIKFDKKRQYSTINQAGNINFILDSAGTEKNAIYKVEIVSDGAGEIDFSVDFEVIGEVDKTKNQVIYFTRESLVEFKPTAVIMNVGKSGQTTPINLDDDAEIFYNKILATGATLTNTEIIAMNNFYLAMKSHGYYSKMKGIYIVMGNNTASRLLNGVPGKPDATLVSGTVTNDGINGVLDSGMKPSEIFALDSFSYGIHNTTPTYSNLGSMGCSVSSTSGILLICTAITPSGQFFFSGPNRDIYANAANADSLGVYVVSRTGLSMAKLFKNGNLLFTHSVSQGSGTLPNINFAIGGYNNNGIFEEDTRTTKWAFLADGLTDSEVVNVTTDFNNLMTAIGR